MHTITEVLTGIVNRVTYHNPSTGWSVLRVQPFQSPQQQETVTLMGNGFTGTMLTPESLTRFITLQMESYPALEVVAQLEALEGVLQVTNPQKNEFVVAYNSALQPAMDLQIMQCLQNNHWRYRQMSHGKTLEEKLFFSE